MPFGEPACNPGRFRFHRFRLWRTSYRTGWSWSGCRGGSRNFVLTFRVFICSLEAKPIRSCCGCGAVAKVLEADKASRLATASGKAATCAGVCGAASAADGAS